MTEMWEEVIRFITEDGLVHVRLVLEFGPDGTSRLWGCRTSGNKGGVQTTDPITCLECLAKK